VYLTFICKRVNKIRINYWFKEEEKIVETI